ncbi:MAG: LptA/OstA family protein [Spirochaetales bacterium]|uniref:LptA/OstA family protein n=1 Tax=Candidatus Thalassospirochaeta sargassi TaxID=3119039 RepID=A0AAJ1MJR8_9SPIO|nr:LptA/OstA family protein [Spirochaetales bacterium]
MNKRTILIICLMVLSGSICFSQADEAPKNQTPVEEEKDNTFRFSSNRTEAVLAKGREHTVLEGNAEIITGSREIRADRIDIYGEDFEIAVCSGNVNVFDQENDTTLVCENLKFNRETEVVIVEGYSELEDRKNELIAKSGFIEQKSREEFTILQIGVRILKISDGEIMSCRSEYAGFDQKNNILELTGMPRVYWKGDNYEASRIIVDLDTDEIKLEGNVRGSISSDE